MWRRDAKKRWKSHHVGVDLSQHEVTMVKLPALKHERQVSDDPKAAARERLALSILANHADAIVRAKRLPKSCTDELYERACLTADVHDMTVSYGRGTACGVTLVVFPELADEPDGVHLSLSITYTDVDRDGAWKGLSKTLSKLAQARV